MSDDLQRQILALAEAVQQLTLDRAVDEQLILALLESHGSKHQLAQSVREIAEMLLEHTDGAQSQAHVSMRVNAALEALGESPGRPPE